MGKIIKDSSFQTSIGDILKRINENPQTCDNLYKFPKTQPMIGFESTWRYKNVLRQKALDESQEDNYPDVLELTNNDSFMQEYRKLKQWDTVQADPHNIEIPTNKVTSKRALLADFKRLSKLMDKYGYIESSRSFNNNFEGGGHIHIDYGEIFGNLGAGNDYCLMGALPEILLDLRYSKHDFDKKHVNAMFALFTQNIYNFIINNPWIPWAFNAPNDNICAVNNLICENLEKDYRMIRNTGLQLTSDLTIDIKQWAITLRPSKNTFEFRFFGMPKNANELSLHIDLAQAIFKHCYDITMLGKSKAIKPIYKDWKDLTDISYKKSLAGLKEVCKTLNINYDDLVTHGKIENLKIRYAYHQGIINSGEEFKKDQMVLN
jgi:hypothetical protein